MDACRSEFGIGVCLLMLMSFGPPRTEANSLAQCGLDDVRYEVIELHTEGSSATTLNDRGEVAGISTVEDRGLAFHWDCMNQAQSIDSSPDHLLSQPHDINNRGQIVGESYEPDATFAWIWDRTNGMRQISDQQMIAYEINDWGEVALIAGPASIWSESQGLRAFDELTGVEWWGFPRINNLRSVGGMRVTAEGESGPQFTVWNKTTGARDRGLVVDDYVTVDGMNDRGDLVGVLFREPSGVPFILNANRELELLASPGNNSWSQVFDVNNRRQVLGLISDDTGSMNFIWDPVNGLRDFQEVASELADQPDRRYGASAVNNWGWIAGSVTEPGAARSKAALFVPVPRNSVYFNNLPSLSGARLCRALDAVKLNAVLSCLLGDAR